MGGPSVVGPWLPLLQFASSMMPQTLGGRRSGASAGDRDDAAIAARSVPVPSCIVANPGGDRKRSAPQGVFLAPRSGEWGVESGEKKPKGGPSTRFSRSPLPPLYSLHILALRGGG